MMNNQNVLHKKWVQTPSIENRNNFTSCRNNVIKAIRVSKRRYYDKLITRKKNSSEVFDAFNYFCGEKNVNTALFDVNVFNEHFATIGEKLTENFKQNVYRSNFPVNKNTFVKYDTHRYEILKEIKNLNNKKSTGHDGICSKMVKISAPVLADHLAHFFNICFEKECFLNFLKIAKVLPLHKNGDKTEPNNYRPISLLSCINKLFEKLIFMRISNFAA